MRWLCTPAPAIWLDLSVPLMVSIALATSKFSPPLSDLTLDGQPWSSVAPKRCSNTVLALLVLDACRYITFLENPSIQLCTTNRHQIRQCNPSICHKALKDGTLYTQHLTAREALLSTAAGHTLIKLSLTLLLETYTS